MMLLKATFFWFIFSMLTNRKDVDMGTVEDEYDFVIVGAGTSGSVIANRLSEDPNMRILVLEAGGSDEDDIKIPFPMNWPILQRSPVDWNYKIEPQKHTNEAVPDRTEQWPRGKVLGGSTTINGMMYIRGSPHDYNSWADRGAAGWGWKDVEPYFRKFEGDEDDMSDRLGKDGPVKLSKRFETPMHHLLTKAAQEIGVKKTNYHDDIEGISPISATVHSGFRQNAAGAYLHPILRERKESLHVVTKAHVTKITLNQTRPSPQATGVVYIKDGREMAVRARKEVIVSAGVIETPHLLMLSGIGHKLHLKRHGIHPIVHLPGVGANLQDHPMLTLFYHAKQMPPRHVINPTWLKETMMQYVTGRGGPWHTPVGQDTNIHFRSRSGRLSASKQKHPFPDIQILILNAANDSAVFKPPQEKNDTRSLSFFAAIGLSHPKSRGTVRLKSKDPLHYPAVDPNYLGHEDDVSLYIEGLHLWEEMERTGLFSKIKAELITPPYCKEGHNEYPPRSEEFYRCLLRHRVSTQYHPCCTAKMGSNDDRMAVVDERLRVHGVRNLRIADASVMPHITSANTQSPCYMIGEKAADILKQDWKMALSPPKTPEGGKTVSRPVSNMATQKS